MNQPPKADLNPYASPAGEQVRETAGGPTQLPHSGPGIASTIFGGLAGTMLILEGLYLSTTSHARPVLDMEADRSGYEVFLIINTVLFFGIWICSISGTICGLIGAGQSKQERRKNFVVVGLTLNLPFILFGIGVIVQAIMMAPARYDGPSGQGNAASRPAIVLSVSELP